MRALTAAVLLLLAPAASAQMSCLSGSCQDGQGRARYDFASGNHEIFEGRFLRGEPTGEGTLTMSTGWTYEGQFSGRLLDGIYLATHTNGQQERVRFDEGTFVEVVERIRTPVRASGNPTLVLNGAATSGTISPSDARVPLTASDDVRPADVYTLSLAAGQTARVRMESSNFDTYLKVMRDGSFVVRNDDFSSTSVSQVEITAPTAGTYTVYAGTFTERGAGAYMIRASGQGEPAGSSLTYCALDGTVIREFEARYDPASGRHYAPDGRLVSEPGTFSSWVLEMGRYAEDEPWYIDNDPVEVSGSPYVKYGLPRVLGVNEVSFLAEAGGAAVFTEAGATGTPEIVYVAVRPGCEFQPYQLDLESRPNGIRDPEPTVLFLDGMVTSGTVTSGDPSVPLTASDDLRPADAYALMLSAGQTATVRMESTAFDTYLKVVRDGEVVVRNDDFEGSRSVSQVTFTAASAGTYTVYAGAFSASGSGAYTVRASLESGRTSASGPTDETVVQGALTDGDRLVPLPLSDEPRRADAYLVDARAGQRIVVEMTSDRFDTYLRVERNGTKVAYNDDAGSTSRSYVEYTVENSGTHTIYAGTFSEAGRGNYTVRYWVE